MKICVVAYKFGTEQEIGEHLGTYHYFIETLRRMSKAGHEVIVVAPWISWASSGSRQVGGVRVERYYPPLFNHPKLLLINRLLRFWYILATGRKVLAVAEREQPGVICVWQARETGYAVARIAEQLSVPFIFRQITAWQWHFDRMRLDRGAQERFAKKIYQTARQIIFVSQAAAEAEKGLGLPEKKIRTLGVAIETDLFKPSGNKKTGKYVLFIGRINFAEKGIGVLLRAVPKILETVPQALLQIVGGGGEEERMREEIKSLGIEKSVELLGKQPFERLPEILNSAEVLVVPSLWLEAFGQVTIEAMASGVPVVTSDIGGSTEINVDGGTGFIVPRGDVDALAEAVIKLLRDRELRERLGKAARKRALENYTYEVLNERFLSLMKEAEND